METPAVVCLEAVQASLAVRNRTQVGNAEIAEMKLLQSGGSFQESDASQLRDHVQAHFPQLAAFLQSVQPCFPQKCTCVQMQIFQLLRCKPGQVNVGRVFESDEKIV